MALLEFQNTPITGLDESPAQLLMSRHLRSHLPRIPAMLQPTINKGVREKLEQRQQRQKCQYDKRTKPLPVLKPGDTVRHKVNRSWEPATVICQHKSPRSYNIRTSQGVVLRRNRHHLKQTKETVRTFNDPVDDDYGYSISSDTQPLDTASNTQPREEHSQPASLQSGERRSRCGRVIRPPARYGDD